MHAWHSQPYPGAPAASEGGGVEDLQTDVMRFMAMLGLCLVAIFALVQSLPVAPAAPGLVESAAPPVAPSKTVAAPGDAELTKASELPPSVARATPETPSSLPEEEAVLLTRGSSVAENFASPPTAMPPPEPPPEEPGTAATGAVPPAPPALPRTPVFTLRFADAAALLTLVQREEVALFAVDRRGASRLAPSAGRYAFEAAQAPPKMHDMDPASVPAQVRAAYSRSRGLSAGAVRRWGVVLPPRTRNAIDRLLRDPRGGELRIAGDGAVRLVPDEPSVSATENRSNSLVGAKS